MSEKYILDIYTKRERERGPIMSNKREERKLSSASKNINEYFFGKENKRPKASVDQTITYCHETPVDTTNNNNNMVASTSTMAKQQSISQTAADNSNSASQQQQNQNANKEQSSNNNKSSNKDNKFSAPKLFKQRSYDGKKQQQTHSATVDACDIDSLMMINATQDQLQREEPPEHCVFRLGDYSQVASSTTAKNQPASVQQQPQQKVTAQSSSSTHNNIKANLRKLSNPTHRDLKLPKYLQYQGGLPIAGNSSNFASSLAQHSRTVALIGESRIERVRKLITSPLSLRKASTGGQPGGATTTRLGEQHLGTTSSPLLHIGNKSSISSMGSIQKRSNQVPTLHNRRSPSRKQLNLNYKVYGCPLQLANNSYPLTCFGRTETTHKLQPVPYVVTRLCNYIEENSASLTHEGMFRVSGNQRLMEKLRTLFDRLGDAPLESESVDVATSASMLKMYLRELPEPLIPVRMNHIFIAIAKKYTENDEAQSSMDKMTTCNARYDTDTIAGIRSTSMTKEDPTYCSNPMQQMFARDLSNIVRQLPIDNYNSLKYLACFLYRVTLKQLVNKMCASSLGIVFGPNIFRIRTDSYKGLKEQELTNRVVACFISHYKYIFNSDVTDPLGNVVDTYSLENDLLSSLQRKYNKDPPRIQVKSSSEQDSTISNLDSNQTIFAASTSSQVDDQICNQISLPTMASDRSSGLEDKVKPGVSVCIASCCESHSPVSSCEDSCDEDEEDDDDESYTPSETTSCSNEYSGSIESSEIYSMSDDDSSSDCHSVTSYTPSSDMDQSSSESQSFGSSTSFTSAENPQSSKERNHSNKIKKIEVNDQATTSDGNIGSKVDNSAEKMDHAIGDSSPTVKPINRKTGSQSENDRGEDVIPSKGNTRLESVSSIAADGTIPGVDLEDVVFHSLEEVCNPVSSQSPLHVSSKQQHRDKSISGATKDDIIYLARNNPKSKSLFRRKKTSSRKRSSTSSNQDLSHSLFEKFGQLQHDNVYSVGETSQKGVTTKPDICEKIKRFHNKGRHSRSSKRQSEKRNIRKHMKRRSSSAGSLNRSKRLVQRLCGKYDNNSVDFDESYRLKDSQVECLLHGSKDEIALKKTHRHPANKKDANRESRHKSTNSIIQSIEEVQAHEAKSISDHPFSLVLPDITSELVVSGDPQLIVHNCALNELGDTMEFYTFRRFNSDETLLRSTLYYENYESFRRFSNQELGREEETYFQIEPSMNNDEGAINELIEVHRSAIDDHIGMECPFNLRKSNSVVKNQHVLRDNNLRTAARSHAKRTKIKSGHRDVNDNQKSNDKIDDTNVRTRCSEKCQESIKRNRHKSHDLTYHRRESSRRIQRKEKDRSYSAGNDVDYKSISTNISNNDDQQSKTKKAPSPVDDEKLSSDKFDEIRLQRFSKSSRERGANLPKIQSISIVSLLESKENNVNIINYSEVDTDGILDPIDEHLALLKTDMADLKAQIKASSFNSGDSSKSHNSSCLSDTKALSDGNYTIVAPSSSTLAHSLFRPSASDQADISKLVFELKHLRRRFNEMKRIRNHYECYHSTDKNNNNSIVSNASIVNQSSSSRSQGSLDSLKPQMDKVFRLIFSNNDISTDNGILQSRSSSIKEFCTDNAFSPERSLSMSFLNTNTRKNNAANKIAETGECSNRKATEYNNEGQRIVPVRHSLTVDQKTSNIKQSDGNSGMQSDRKLKLECNFGMICPVRFVVEIEKRLNEKRKLCDRPYDTAFMSPNQLHDEKLELQKNLLRYEHWFGRPTTRQELSIVGHLYNRYRTIKQAQGLSKASGSGSSLMNQNLFSAN